MVASLATHLSGFLFLLPLGIRRLVCSFSLYLKNPSLFRSKPWHLSEPRWKNLDLYVLLIALPIASFSDIFLFLTFTGHPTHRFAFFQQSAVILLFWALVVLILLRESSDFFLVPEGFVFGFAGISFLIEYSLMGKGMIGLGGVVYELLGGLTLVCAGSCLYLSIRPSAFFAEFLLSSGIIFKATWILQAGLSLYSDTFSLKGCQRISIVPAQGEADVHCALEEDSLRGISLMNLLFIGHAMGVLIFSFVLFGLLSCNRNLRCGEGSGPLLAEIEPESSFMRPIPQFEIECSVKILQGLFFSVDSKPNASEMTSQLVKTLQEIVFRRVLWRLLMLKIVKRSMKTEPVASLWPHGGNLCMDHHSMCSAQA